MTTTLHYGKVNKSLTTTLFPFLYKSSKPFSNLFYMVHHSPPPSQSTEVIKKQKKEEQEVLHDEELCMFSIQLNSSGTIAAICYLPTTVKNVIEIYHTEIPVAYRHKGNGDRLVKTCLDWAIESNTKVIPSCTFVKKYLAANRLEKYDDILV